MSPTICKMIMKLKKQRPRPKGGCRASEKKKVHVAFYHYYPCMSSCLTYRFNFTFYVFNIWLLCKKGGGQGCLNVKFDNNSVKARPSVSKNLVGKGVLMYALSCQTLRRVTGTTSFLARAQTNETNYFKVSGNRRVDMFQGRYENHIYENL
jgi:hypothetical protein